VPAAFSGAQADIETGDKPDNGFQFKAYLIPLETWGNNPFSCCLFQDGGGIS
jgi:hypothetical protein